MQVNDIHIASDGLVWLGTRGGICTFDGIDFDTFDDIEDTPFYVIDIGELSDGTIYALSGSALYFWRGDHFDKYDFEETIKIGRNATSHTDELDRIWINSFMKETGVVCFTDSIQHAEEAMPILKDMNLKTILPYKDKYYLGVDDGLYICLSNNELDTIYQSVGEEKVYFRASQSKYISGLYSGFNIFIQSPYPPKVLFYNFEDHTIDTVYYPEEKRFMNLDDKEYFYTNLDGLHIVIDSVFTEVVPNIKEDFNQFLSLDIDTQHTRTYYVGTDKGLVISRSQPFVSYSEHDYPFVWAISENENNDIIFGTYGNGLYKLKDSKQLVKDTNSTRHNKNIRMSVYLGISRGPEDQLYIPFASGLYELNNDNLSHVYPDALYYDPTLFSYYDSEKDLIFLAKCPGIEVIDTSFSQFKEREDLGFKHSCILTILKDENDGQYWFGGGGGLCKYDLDKDTVTQVYTYNKGNLPILGATCSMRDREGDYWFGSRKGITRYIPEQDSFQVFPQFDNYIVGSMIQYDDEKCFLGVLEGLLMIDLLHLKETGTVKSRLFTEADGFTGLECGQNGFYIDSQNMLWTTSSTDVVKVNPNLLEYRSEDLPVTLKTINNKRVSNREHVTLPYNVNEVYVEAGLTTYHQNRTIVYRFKLNDDHWTEWSSQKVHVYSDLTGGEHLLSIQAKQEHVNNDNASETLSILTISQPIYNEPWFSTVILLILGVLASVLAYIYRRRSILIENNYRLQQEKSNLVVKTQRLTSEKKELIFEMTEVKQLNEKLNAFINKQQHIDQTSQQQYLILKSLNKTYKIVADVVLSFTAEDNGVRVVTEEDSFWVDDTLKNLLNTLTADNFIRIHRSTIINIKHIKWINSTTLQLVDGSNHSIGRTYKQSIQHALG